jgi:hypothetical protein
LKRQKNGSITHTLASSITPNHLIDSRFNILIETEKNTRELHNNSGPEDKMTTKQLNNLFMRQQMALGGFLVTILLAMPSAASESNSLQASHAGNLVLSVSGNKVSARIEHASLQNVLEALEKRTQLKIITSTTLDDKNISLSFEHLLLPHALKKILLNHNYVLSSDDNHGLLLRILGNTRSRPSPPLSKSPSVLQNPFIFDRKLSQEKLGANRINDLYASNSKLRLAALKELAEKGKENEIKDAQSVLIAALEDEHENTRTRMLALETLDRLKKGVPFDTLAPLASDTDPDMRVQALGLIVERGRDEAEPYLSEAMNDPDPKVRTFALDVSELFTDL